MALGAVAISSDNSEGSTSAWLIPLVICFVIALCLLATAMLFYVKCYGTQRRVPKTTLVNISGTRVHFIPSFAKSRNFNKIVKKSVRGQPTQNRLDRELNLNNSSSQFDTSNVFSRAEFQLLPTSSDSNFAGSSDMRQSTLGKAEICLHRKIGDAKRMSQRYNIIVLID